jgi:transposase
MISGFGTPPGVRVLVATRPVDFRRGADGLARTVQSILQQDRFSGTVFVFRSKRADRVKLRVYDGTGLVLIWKRLEGSTFNWPPVSEGVMPLSGAQLAALFDGLDWRRMPLGSPARRWPGELRPIDSPPARGAASRCTRGPIRP